MWAMNTRNQLNNNYRALLTKRKNLLYLLLSTVSTRLSLHDTYSKEKKWC